MAVKVRKVLLGMTCAAALGALPVAADASPITPYVGAQGNVAFYNSSTNIQDGGSACSAYSSSGATVGCSGSTTAPTSGATLNYLTTATAGYGVLKAGGTSSITNASGTSNTTDYSSSYGQAYFADSWTITGATGTGTLELQFALDGSYDFSQVGSGAVEGFGLVNLDNYSYSSGTPSFSSGGPGTISNTVLLSTSFTFGTPVDFLVSLTAGSNLYDLGHDISSYLDLSDTAQMNAIIVKDANGNVIPFDLTTGSGAPLFTELAPGVPSASVPEPSSLALFAGLLGLLIWFGRAGRLPGDAFKR
jgi:hypothetical protein